MRLSENMNKRNLICIVDKVPASSPLVLVGREFKTNLEISETHSIYDRHREAIQMAVEYIDTHYQEDLMVEDVARISSCLLHILRAL